MKYNKCPFLVITIIILMGGCDSSNLHEKEFYDFLNDKLLKMDEVTTSFSSLYDIKWDEICFSDNIKTTISFKNKNNTLIEVNLDDDKVFIKEEYNPSSPARKCFSSKEKFKIIKTTVNYKYIFLILKE